MNILDITTNGLKLDLKELTQQLKKLLKKLFNVYRTPDKDDFISGIFTRDNKDENKSMILNLKKLSTISTLK